MTPSLAHRTLELKANPSLEDVQSQWRKLVLVHHPDRHVGASEDEREYSAQKTKQLNQAYSLLRRLGLRESSTVSAGTSTVVSEASLGALFRTARLALERAEVAIEKWQRQLRQARTEIFDQQRLRVDLSQQSKTLRGLAELYKKAAHDKRIRLTEILDLFVFTPENNRRKEVENWRELSDDEILQSCLPQEPQKVAVLFSKLQATQRDYSRDILARATAVDRERKATANLMNRLQKGRVRLPSILKPFRANAQDARRLLDHAHASVITVEKAAATLESGPDHKDFVKHIKRGLIEFNQQLKGAEMSQTEADAAAIVYHNLQSRWQNEREEFSKFRQNLQAQVESLCDWLKSAEVEPGEFQMQFLQKLPEKIRKD